MKGYIVLCRVLKQSLYSRFTVKEIGLVLIFLFHLQAPKTTELEQLKQLAGSCLSL